MTNKKQRQTPAPVTSYNQCNVKESGLKPSSEFVRIKKPRDGFLILRFLVTKLYSRREKLTDREEFLLFGTVEYFRSLRIDENQKFRQNVKLLALQQSVQIFLKIRDQELPKYMKERLKILLPQCQLSPRAFLGLKKGFINRFFKRDNPNLRRKLPDPRYIGVGYRDKGATSVLSFDGSPHWKEIASYGPKWIDGYSVEYLKRQIELRRLPLFSLIL